MNMKEITRILRQHLLWIFRKGSNFAIFADLRGADLRDATLRGANLMRANLRGANLRGADLRGADLRGADLSDADLMRADLRGADLRDATLMRADLMRADLRGADLMRAKIDFIDLQTYVIYFANDFVSIGCKTFSILEWENFVDREILAFDGNRGLVFWKTHKPFILSTAKYLRRKHDEH